MLLFLATFDLADDCRTLLRLRPSWLPHAREVGKGKEGEEKIENSFA